MADGNLDSYYGIVGATTNNVTPEFDEFGGKVTDAKFRADLPLLMLWLDRHKPIADAFKDKVDKNGYLLEKYKKIIRNYDPLKD